MYIFQSGQLEGARKDCNVRCIDICILYLLSDECVHTLSPSNAVNILGLAIGVSIAGFIVFLVVPITICVIIWCCVAGAASQAGHAGRTTYVGTAAPTTAATVVSTTAAYPAGGYNYPKQV